MIASYHIFIVRAADLKLFMYGLAVNVNKRIDWLIDIIFYYLYRTLY